MGGLTVLSVAYQTYQAAFLSGGQYFRAAHTLDNHIFVVVAHKFNGEGLL